MSGFDNVNNEYRLEKLREACCTHNSTNTDEYHIWCDIKNRCYNENYKQYNDYGGRGIKMSDEWFSNSSIFLSDMGPRPSKEHSIDRIDVNGDYCKENCRWATKTEQNNNRRDNVYFEYDGNKYYVLEASKKFDIPSRIIRQRIREGWNGEQIVKTPINQLREEKHITLNGDTKTLTDWCNILNIKYCTVWRRIKCGWTEEKALITPVKTKNN